VQFFDDPTVDYLEPEVVARPSALLATAAVAGIAAEVALHTSLVGSAPLGLGIPIAVAAVVAGLIYGAVQLDTEPDTATLGMYLLAIGFAALTAIRASAPLAAINVMASMTLVGLAATAHNPAAIRPSFLAEFGRAAQRVIGASWIGGFLVLGRDLRSLEFRRTEKLRRIAVGFMVALPMLAIFGSLFVSADQVFGNAVARVTKFDLPDTLAAALTIAAFLSWCVLGLLRSILTQPSPVPEHTARRFLGATEAATAMWLVNGLFALFVGFQIYEVAASYQSADVSYAQQARSGFFQLVWVAAIVVVVVLLLDWMVAARDHRRLHGQQFVLIALTGLVLMSAIVRMALYVDAYGLTRLRVFTTVFMLWVAFVLGWLTRSVLIGKRRRFARPALAGLLAATLALNIVNPDSLIATYNLERQPRLASSIDLTYLHHELSADAVPAIIANMDRLGSPCEQLRLVSNLGVDQEGDIRNWNLSRSRAAGLIEAVQRELEGLCQSG